jgi:hypothetical protein
MGFYTRSPIVRGRLLVRAQSAIRADGTPSAQALSLQFDASYYVDRYRRSDHCARRAPTLFSVRMKSASVPKTRLLRKAKADWNYAFDSNSNGNSNSNTGSGVNK